MPGPSARPALPGWLAGGQDGASSQPADATSSPQRPQRTIVGLPRPHSAPRSGPKPQQHDQPSSGREGQMRPSRAHPTNSPAHAPEGAQRSLMELVNAAARREEAEEAEARASGTPRCAGHNSTSGSAARIGSRSAPGSPATSTSGRSNPFAAGHSSSSRRSSSLSVTRPPSASGLLRAPSSSSSHTRSSSSSHSRSSHGQGRSSRDASHSHSRSSSPRRTSEQPRSAAPAVGRPPAAQQPASVAGPSGAAVSAASAFAVVAGRPLQSPSVSHMAAVAAAAPKSRPLEAGAIAASPRGSSDGCSDDGVLTPESSLCSSASNSSLASYGSIASSAASAAAAAGLMGRPRSILLNRSSASSASSSCAGGAPKSVRWRDGARDHRDGAGADLVAVRLLQDTPEIRRLRKDTWPERPPTGRSSSSSSSRDAATAAAASASASTGLLGVGSSAAAVAEGAANQVIAAVMDWREKLRVINAERRLARVAQLQASWTARQQQQHAAQQQQHVAHQHQQQQADAAAAQSALDDDEVDATAVAVADTAKVVSQQPGSGGPVVISVQAVAGAGIAIPSH